MELKQKHPSNYKCQSFHNVIDLFAPNALRITVLYRPMREKGNLIDVETQLV